MAGSKEAVAGSRSPVVDRGGLGRADDDAGDGVLKEPADRQKVDLGGLGDTGGGDDAGLGGDLRAAVADPDVEGLGGANGGEQVAHGVSGGVQSVGQGAEDTLEGALHRGDDGVDGQGVGGEVELSQRTLGDCVGKAVGHLSGRSRANEAQVQHGSYRNGSGAGLGGLLAGVVAGYLGLGGGTEHQDLTRTISSCLKGGVDLGGGNTEGGASGRGPTGSAPVRGHCLRIPPACRHRQASRR